MLLFNFSGILHDTTSPIISISTLLYSAFLYWNDIHNSPVLWHSTCLYTLIKYLSNHSIILSLQDFNHSTVISFKADAFLLFIFFQEPITSLQPILLLTISFPYLLLSPVKVLNLHPYKSCPITFNLFLLNQQFSSIISHQQPPLILPLLSSSILFQVFSYLLLKLLTNFTLHSSFSLFRLSHYPLNAPPPFHFSILLQVPLPFCPPPYQEILILPLNYPPNFIISTFTSFHPSSFPSSS